MMPLKNRPLLTNRFERFVDICMDNSGIANPDYETFRESVRYLAGAVLRKPMIETLAHRLAGNFHRLKHHIPVQPWTRQDYHEWVPVQAIEVCRVFHEKWGAAARLTLKILAGSPASITVRQRWSVKRCRVIARDLGFRNFGRRRNDPPPFPFATVEELTSMRWEMMVEPDLSDTEPYLSKTRTRPALQDWNRNLLKMRTRKGFDCLVGHPINFPCSQCAVGYLTCPAGTHRDDWKVKHCQECGERDALWDYQITTATCLNCYHHSIHRRK